MAATATNTAVQVPCVDNALKLMEIPKIPDAEVKIVTLYLLAKTRILSQYHMYHSHRAKPMPRTSRPTRPNKIPPASSIP